MVVQSETELLQVVAALHAASCLAGCLDGWQKQTHQDANDGDDYQEFHQGETTTDFKPLHKNKSPKKTNG
jgi:hypothetical protein